MTGMSAHDGPDTTRPARTVKANPMVLVMDDDAMVGPVIIFMLKKCGCRVVLAKDGAQAIDLYRQAQSGSSPFDIVFLDIMVPNGMGGKEAAQHLRRLDPSVKIVASTGYSDDVLVSRFAEFGFDAILIKPYNNTALAGVLQETLGA